MYAGTIMKSKATASGKAVMRYGSRQTKVYVARKDKVWVGFRQVNSRMRRFWKTKTIPILLTVKFA